MPAPPPISGYVLAGGRSSRMGRDKALIPLAGKPLIEHVVTKLRRICADVSILSNAPALAAFATIVPDVHPNSGPIGGIEAALAHTSHDWNLFFPVDMPLLPAALLDRWIAEKLAPCASNPQPPGIHIFAAAGRPQPGLCLMHRAVAPLIHRAIQREEFSLISVFEEVSREAGSRYVFSTSSLEQVVDSSLTGTHSEMRQSFTPTQVAARHLWFLNINTREDLALAEAQTAALDI